MDHDVLAKQFREFRDRVTPMLEDYEAHKRRERSIFDGPPPRLSTEPASLMPPISDDLRDEIYAPLNAGTPAADQGEDDRARAEKDAGDAKAAQDEADAETLAALEKEEADRVAAEKAKTDPAPGENA